MVYKSQEFPADKPGQYINWLYLGPVSISLLADYSQAKPDRIDVSFVWLQVQLGALKFKRVCLSSSTHILVNAGMRRHGYGNAGCTGMIDIANGICCAGLQEQRDLGLDIC